MSPILRLLLAILMGGMAVWFMRSSSERGEAGYWFLALLLVASTSALLSAVSWWVKGDTVSRSFWMAHTITLSLSIFLVFCFTRSFNSKPNFTLLFWSLPFMLDLAIIIVDAGHLVQRSGRAWVPKGGNAFLYLHMGIAVFYAVISLYYCFMVYNALKLSDERRKSVRFGYILAGLLIIFASQLMAASLHAILSPSSPVAEAGSLVGAFLLWLGIVEPRAIFLDRKGQRVA